MSQQSAPLEQPTGRVANIILVDARGHLLLQERDEHPALHPDCWSLCGGAVEEGETSIAGALRELAEETALEPDGGLEIWEDIREWPSVVEIGRNESEWFVWVGPTAATDADVVCGEGRQIVFVDPARLDSMALSPVAAEVLPRLLASDAYPGLVEAAKALPPYAAGPR